MLQPYIHTKEDPTLKILLYGPPGVGKTVFAGSASEVGKTLFLNVEGGMMSVPASENVLVFDIANTEEFTAYQYVESIIEIIAGGDTKQFEWLKGLKTLVLDSGSELLTIALESIVSQQMEVNSRRTDEFDIWVDDYGKATASLKSLYRKLKSLPINVIVTALSREISKKQDRRSDAPPEIIAIKPDFTPKLSESVMGYFDHVWYMFRGDQKEEDGSISTAKYPSILTQPHGVFRAKTRGTAFSEALGIKYDNPTFTSIMNILIKSETNKGKTK